MVTRSLDSGNGPEVSPETLLPGPGAVEHLDRLLAAVDGLLARPPSRPSPLDLRLVHEEVAIKHGLDDRNQAWNDGVFTALGAGTALDEAMPETIEASTARRALHALLDSLRFEVDLEHLRDIWPRIRADLRCYVLGLVREDAAEDLVAIRRALQACGIRPLEQPEPNAAGAALRTLLRELLATRETDRARFELRTALLKAHARGATPRLGRYLLARELSEREAVVASEGVRLAEAEARALIEDPRPGQLPNLPTSFVAPALILLATLDVIESRAVPDRPWRGRSAYNVLRVVSAEARWPADQRVVMESVLNGSVPPDEDLLAMAQQASAGHGASSIGLGPTARGTCAETPLRTGDGTETSKARFVAGPSEVSSPAPSGATAATGDHVRNASAGGDGTETIKPASEAGSSEVSSPGTPTERAADVYDEGMYGVDGAAPGDGTRTAAAVGSTPLLVRGGEVWSVTWGTKTYSLVHRLGFEGLQVLLSTPGVPVACADLVQGRALEHSHPQEVADREALARIYGELRDLEGLHSEGAEEQRTRLRQEVMRLVTPAGRPRTLDRERRKLQQAVYKRIQGAVRAISDVYPELGAHLRACVTTGARCCYDPNRGRSGTG